MSGQQKRIVLPSGEYLNARLGRNVQEADDEVVQIGGLVDSPLNDAFGRLRVSDPVTVFDSQMQYDKLPLLYYEDTSGGASSTHLPNESAVQMDCTTSDGDSIIRQSKAYHRYQPGKSQFILTTFDFGASVVGARKRVGYFDGDNGVFIEDDGGAVAVVLRSKVSGTVVETRVAQAAWDDPLDGAGYSGLTLDITKAQIFCLDLEWLGVGRVRAGFVINGALVHVHSFNHANINSTTYMTTANLPLRWELTNTVATAVAPSMRQICGTVISEGGFEEDRGLPRCSSNGVTTRAITTRSPLMAIRPAATFNSIVNRAMIIPNQIEAWSGDQAAWCEVVYNPTVTGGSWAAVTDSVVEENVTLTSITGGTKIASFYANAGGQGSGKFSGAGEADVLSKLPLTLDIDGANPIPLVIMATSIPGTSTAMSAQLSWREFR